MQKLNQSVQFGSFLSKLVLKDLSPTPGPLSPNPIKMMMGKSMSNSLTCFHGELVDRQKAKLPTIDILFFFDAIIPLPLVYECMRGRVISNTSAQECSKPFHLLAAAAW